MTSLSIGSGSLASGAGKICCFFCQFWQNLFESNVIHPNGQQIIWWEKKKRVCFHLNCVAEVDSTDLCHPSFFQVGICISSNSECIQLKVLKELETDWVFKYLEICKYKDVSSYPVSLYFSSHFLQHSHDDKHDSAMISAEAQNKTEWWDWTTAEKTAQHFLISSMSLAVLLLFEEWKQFLLLVRKKKPEPVTDIHFNLRQQHYRWKSPQNGSELGWEYEIETCISPKSIGVLNQTSRDHTKDSPAANQKRKHFEKCHQTFQTLWGFVPAGHRTALNWQVGDVEVLSKDSEIKKNQNKPCHQTKYQVSLAGVGWATCNSFA